MTTYDVSYWEIFYTGELFLIFPRFNNRDYSIGLDELYYHKSNLYIESKKHINSYRAQVNELLISPFYKKYKDPSKFMPCFCIANSNTNLYEIERWIKSCTFIEDFVKLTRGLALFSIMFYPGKYIKEYIRVDKTALLKLGTISWNDFFSKLLVISSNIPGDWIKNLDVLTKNLCIESSNLGWLRKYNKSLINDYRSKYLCCEREYNQKDNLFRIINLTYK